MSHYDAAKRVDQPIKIIKQVTYDEDGYPCFVTRERFKKDWGALDDHWKQVYIHKYTYLQEVYGDDDPHFGDIECAIMGGA